MRHFNVKDEHFMRNQLTRILLIIITVALIVWFLPRTEEQRFRYDVGKPWMYGAFITKFDFPIYKTDEAIKAEQDSLMATFQPYYNFNENVEKVNIQKLRNNFPNGIPGLTDGQFAAIIQQLRNIYQRGVIPIQEYNKIAKDSTSMIRVVVGKQAKTIPVASLYSTLEAYEQLFNNEKLLSQRQILQQSNLNEYIDANLIYDKSRNQTEEDELISSISQASGMMMAGQKIIDRGEIVNDYTYRVLSSFEREMKRRNATKTEITTTIIGQSIFVTIMVVLFTLYLLLFRKDYFDKPRNITMLYALITIFPILVSLMVSHSFLNIYIIPFALIPIFVRIFMDSRTAFITHATIILICAVAVKYQYEFIIMQLVTGLVAIYSLRELSSRAQVFKTALLVTIAEAVVYYALQLMQENEIAQLDYNMNTYLVINGILLLLAYPLMFLIEKMFGFVSNVTLFELSNTNKGLLRDLSEIAPGTFQHVINVGNLAAEIANKIEANSLLVRTGALYHDIGKMSSPAFFTENQAGVNPHDNMDYKESARIIVNHVAEGIRLAEKAGLPTIIKDFILTHHGLGVTKYFYIKYKNEHADEDIDNSDFMYPGPNPFTLEQAILMMADSVEAASHSLTTYTEECITELVNNVIDAQVADGYFKECPITFLDIAQAKTVLIERLKSIYHTRISYPKLNADDEDPK